MRYFHRKCHSLAVGESLPESLRTLPSQSSDGNDLLDNMKYCKKYGIHLNDPKLGKHFTDQAEAKRHKKMEWLESGEWGKIERYFGVGKRRYSLDCIVTKLKETNEVIIHPIVISMNLRKKLRLLLYSLFSLLQMMIQTRLKERDFALA